MGSNGHYSSPHPSSTVETGWICLWGLGERNFSIGRGMIANRCDYDASAAFDTFDALVLYSELFLHLTATLGMATIERS